MEIKVDFEQLDNVNKIATNNKDALSIEINKLLDSLERLKTIWYGRDLERFYSNAHEYIRRMKVLCTFMESTTEFINTVSNNYKIQDEDFSKTLNKEVDLLDEQQEHNNY